MHEKRIPLKQILPYSLGGIVLGLCFPALGALLHSLHFDLPLTLTTFITLQRENSMLWVIDSAPIFLGLLATLVGMRTAQLKQMVEDLDQAVEKRARDIQLQSSYYQALIQNSPLAIVTLDHHHRIVALNPAFESLFGYSREEVLGKDLDDIITTPDFKEEAVAYTQRVMGNQPLHAFGQRRRKDGTFVAVEIHGVPVIINGQHVGALALYQDISDRMKAEISLKESEARFRSLFDNSPIALMELDFSAVKALLEPQISSSEIKLLEYFETHPQTLSQCLHLAMVLTVNQAALELFQANEAEEFLDAGLPAIFEPQSFDHFRDCLIKFLEADANFECALQLKTFKGKTIFTVIQMSLAPGHEKDWSRVFISIGDITERKKAEEKLRYLSLHDPLTGLYNRAFFDNELEQLNQRGCHPVSMILCDLDDLKLINDRYGHTSGDKALQTVAEILRKSFRQNDVLARIGGDEFVVLLPDMNAPMVKHAIDRIQAHIRRHNQCAAGDAEDPQVNLSIGYATTLYEGEGLIEVFKRADQMMYAVKSDHKVGLSDR